MEGHVRLLCGAERVPHAGRTNEQGPVTERDRRTGREQRDSGRRRSRAFERRCLRTSGTITAPILRSHVVSSSKPTRCSPTLRMARMRSTGSCARTPPLPSLVVARCLVPFSVWLFVPAVPRLPAHNCICIMDKGGRPCGKSAATLKRDREAEEKANPETRQRRMEDENFRRINFFAGHTRATVSAGVDTVNTSGDMQESRAPAGVKKDLPPYRHREENRLYWHQKITTFVCACVL